MPRKMVVLAAGVIGAVVLAAMAVALDAPAYLAFGATAAFVAIGYVLPFRGLPHYLATRQPKSATGQSTATEIVPRAAGAFTTLGVGLTLFSTQAIEANDSVIQAAGWFAVAFVSAAGAITVAGLRYLEHLKAARTS
ncbi:hypothetical protein [Kribbella hippodromi]|uniref:hypothetical protein n=1 Tax=Kribbella hippodromi TaxID=434347 RepID=UPI0031D8B636